LVVCGVVLLGLASPAEAANQRIAVIEFVGQATDSELAELTDEARLGVLDVTKRQAYTVMTKESIATIARDLGVDLSKCTEAECEVDTGRQIGAHFVVTGKVSKIGRRFKFMMKIFDTETAALLAGDTIKAKDMAGLEADLRVFTRRQIADALGMKPPQAAPVPVAAPAPSAGAPARATSSTSFGGGGDMKSAMDAKLKEKRCRSTAEQQGKILREQRLTSAVTQLEAEAKAAYDNLIPTLKVCVQLDFKDRAECRDALTGWLEKVRGAQVQLPAGEETVQTDCGPRLAVFSAAARRASIDTKPAEAMLQKLDKRPSVPAAAPSLSQSTELMELAHKVAELERLLKEYGTCPAMVDNGGTEQGEMVLEQSQMVIQMEEVEDAADMMMFYEQLMPQLESITTLCPGGRCSCAGQSWQFCAEAGRCRSLNHVRLLPAEGPTEAR
jgi:TolB-like protein